MVVLEGKELKRYFGAGENPVRAVDGASLCVQEGEFVSIVGQSGSGKTTLLNLLGGLDRPTDGTVLIGGEDIYALQEDVRTVFRRRHVGFVFQSYNLLPLLNVYENIALPARLDGRAVDSELMGEIVEKLQLEKKLDQMPAFLSGGEQQRVAIARAMLQKPQFVLADEPTGNLDTGTGLQVMELFGLMQERFGQTVVIITHNEAIARTADRILTMEDGRLR